MIKHLDYIDLKRMKKIVKEKAKWTSSANNIRDLAKRCLEQYMEEKGYYRLEDMLINIDEIYQNVIYPKYEFELLTNYDLGFITDTDEKILGKTIHKERVILIDKSIAPESRDPRYTFTLGHEMGHVELHPYIKQPFDCSSKSIAMQTNLYEKQANIFSINLLMPENLVRHRFSQYYNPSKPINYIGEREYWFGRPGRNRKYYISSFQDYCKKYARPLTGYFSNISKESLGYRLYGLGLIQNATKESSYGMPHKNSISKLLAV